MFKANVIISAVAVLLVSCAAAQNAPRQTEQKPASRDMLAEDPGFDSEKVRIPERCVINVFVDDDDQIIVDQEPAPSKRCIVDNRVSMKWRLKQGGPNTFGSAAAITFKGWPLPANPTCALSSARAVSCSFDRPSPGTSYNYSITVLKNGVPLPTLDPHIINN